MLSSAGFVACSLQNPALQLIYTVYPLRGHWSKSQLPLDGDTTWSGSYRASTYNKHSFKLPFISTVKRISSYPKEYVFGLWEDSRILRENTMQTQGEHANSTLTGPGQPSCSLPEPSCGELTVLTTAPLFHPGHTPSHKQCKQQKILTGKSTK